MIKVYSKPNCQQCKFTKKMLDENNVHYTVIDISIDMGGANEIEQLGYRSLPVVVTDSENWSGFQPDKLEKYFN